jgi:hypothetical protein
MTFDTGRTVLRRYWRAGRISFLQLTRVIADDERGLRLWLAAGTPYWRILAADGRTHHDAPIDQLGDDAYLGELTWTGADVMLWMPPGENASSVWWFFDAASGAFRGWYVNLEEPSTRWEHGVDTADNALDVWVAADGTWRWKDVEEFEGRIGLPGYWTPQQAAEIRAEGERLIKLAEAREFPFDGTWCDPRPEVLGFDTSAAAGPSRRPAGWDRPRAM